MHADPALDQEGGQTAAPGHDLAMGLSYAFPHEHVPIRDFSAHEILNR
jgi:hypothetical protein